MPAGMLSPFQLLGFEDTKSFIFACYYFTPRRWRAFKRISSHAGLRISLLLKEQEVGATRAEHCSVSGITHALKLKSMSPSHFYFCHLSSSRPCNIGKQTLKNTSLVSLVRTYQCQAEFVTGGRLNPIRHRIPKIHFLGF